MADEYSKEQYATLKYSNEQFDKNVQFIASGALGISFAFIEKIVQMNKAICKYQLIYAWYIFVFVIFISLIAHFVSVIANRWAIENQCADDDTYEVQIAYFKKVNYKWNYPIRGLNILMILGLLVGLLYLISFIQNNI